MGARDRIRKFLEENVGKVVTTHQIGEVAGISDYQRRIRELRNDEGMQIKTFHDRDDFGSSRIGKIRIGHHVFVR